MAIVAIGTTHALVSTFSKAQQAAAREGFRQDLDTYLLVSGKSINLIFKTQEQCHASNLLYTLQNIFRVVVNVTLLGNGSGIILVRILRWCIWFQKCHIVLLDHHSPEHNCGLHWARIPRAAQWRKTIPRIQSLVECTAGRFAMSKETTIQIIVSC